MGTVPFDTLKQTLQKRRQKGVKRNRPHGLVEPFYHKSFAVV